MSHSGFVLVPIIRIKHMTDKAFLFEMDDGDFWVPKSCVADSEDYNIGDKDLEISILEIFANREGLI